MRVIILTVAIFAALAHGQSSCSGFTDCYDCTTASLGNCGWCQDTLTCSQGTGSGPNSGTCTSWDWVSGDCPATPAPTPDACAQYSDCYDCTTSSLGDCGWCQDSYTCSTGTATGPNSGTCTSWDWVSSDCPATPVPTPNPCNQWTDCYSCTTAPTSNCGWCQDTYTCSQGTGSGPNQGSCTSWDWLSSECPATPTPVPDSCTQWTDCDTCTTAASDNCGWCQDTLTCSIGTSTGPSTGTCTSWDWTSSSCPANKKPMPKTSKKIQAANKH